VVASKAITVADYLAELTPEKRRLIAEIRKLINRHLLKAAVGRGLCAASANAGKMLDLGKSCSGFRSLDEVLPDALAPWLDATSVERQIANYEVSRRRCHRRKRHGDAGSSINFVQQVQGWHGP
jgi:hypothetical protein